ncbi:SpoIIE family protein phosphatase [Pseudoflavonifractor sp. An85]|uniref:SpoIIE family protein phosphatase n=1 Tax=Pseudoflavonifractor sp. An85 TaxID=1965661 RepID=UPI0013022D69|nr:SpoIIE family protein phosphatase [Pseudoflavonifractor sp. An85]
MTGKEGTLGRVWSKGRRVMPLRARLGECAIAFLLTAVLTGAEFLEGHTFFALALVAVWGSGLEGVCALLGACLGYLSFLGFVGGLRYIAASMMVYAVALAVGEFRIYRKSWFMPLMAALLNGAVGFVYQSAVGWNTQQVAAYLAELALTAGAVYCYRQAMVLRTHSHSGPWTPAQVAGVLVLGGTVMMTLARVMLGGIISLGRVLCVLVVMTAAWKGGVGVGAATGVVAGVAMDAAQGTMPYGTLVYALPGLLAGAWGSRGRLVCALSYVVAGAAAVLWMGNEENLQTVGLEVVLGAVLFLLQPEGLVNRLGRVLHQEQREDVGKLGRELAAQQLRRTATAFRAVTGGLREAFAPVPPNDQDTSRIFDRAAEEVCAKCRQRERCWQQEYQATRTALSDALIPMMERGEGIREDFPLHFAGRCTQFESFLAAANRELSSMLARRRYDSRVRESRAAVCAQYGQLAQVLDKAAGQLDEEPNVDPRRQRLTTQRMKTLGIRGQCTVSQDHHGHVHIRAEGPDVERLVQGGELSRLSTLLGCPLRQEGSAKGQVVLVQQEPLVAVAGLAAADRRGQSVSGDSGAWFKDDSGKLNFLLCDGMGSGLAAREDSNCALGLLEKFLRAGLDVEAALATVGEALALRGEAQGGFTTVDLFQVDLFSGRSAVYKLGAAPTYFKKSGGVERVVGRSMPAGVIPGMKADTFPQQLGAGDWVVMVSDGVVSPREDGWMRHLLEDYEGTSPQELAAQILTESGQREGEEDDRTVMVVRLEVRSPQQV